MKRNNELVVSALAFAIVSSLTALVLYSLLGPAFTVQAASYSNTIGGNVAIPNTCIPLASNTVINFGSVPAGSYAATSNIETVTNYGNFQSNIFVDGGNFIYLSNAFLVGNILWDDVSHGSTANGNQLTNSILGADTQLQASANGGTGTVYFGTNVPPPALPGTYQTTVNVMLSC
ncbi:MAG: hypothetical protein KGH57_04265 [Candidatus Micrarchaeota archaeon]|nr:hypothetical protein [Candidatus Micrarchaeota archaeon]